VNRKLYRQVSVTVAKATTADFVTTTEEVEIKDLRVSFDVEKQKGSEPDTCSIRIYNLAERSRALFQAKPLKVTLDAGYDGALERVFSGDMTWAQSVLRGVDWVTEVQVGDGARAHRHARVTRSFEGGTNLRTALSYAANAMGMALPSNIAGAPELTTQYATGVSLNGLASAELSRLLRPFGWRWKTQDGRLVILRPNESRTGEPVLIQGPPDGSMIGTPEFGPPARPKAKPVLRVTTLLEPSICAGARIKLESRSIQGTYRVERALHSGDTHGPNWQTTVEGVAI
jgi:hypothetical protein